MNWLNGALTNLNARLAQSDLRICLTACGGGALLLRNVSTRHTKDLDVVSPIMSATLLESATSVALELGLDPAWLNNGPSQLQSVLQEGWEDRSILVFRASHLKVFSLGTSDLVETKLFAACDRDETHDWEDLRSLNVTDADVREAHAWVALQDANPSWRSHCEKIIKKRLGIEVEKND